MEKNYLEKYLKYKAKYLEMRGGGNKVDMSDQLIKKESVTLDKIVWKKGNPPLYEVESVTITFNTNKFTINSTDKDKINNSLCIAGNYLAYCNIFFIHDDNYLWFSRKITDPLFKIPEMLIEEPPNPVFVLNENLSRSNYTQYLKKAEAEAEAARAKAEAEAKQKKQWQQ